MKNVYLLFLMLVVLSSNAQTITNDWFPREGDFYTVFIATNANELEPGEEGQGQVWDFSAANVGFPDGSLSAYRSPINLQYASDFPSANLALVFGGAENYQQVEDNQWWALGGKSSFSETILDAPYLKFQTPLSFGDSFSDEFQRTSVFISTEMNDTTVADISFTRTFDGVGTLITPAGTIEDCYRIKTERTVELEDAEPATAISYSWYALTLGIERAKMLLLTNGEVSNFSWTEAENFTTPVIETTPAITRVIHLGKGSLLITAELAQNARLVLYNTAGQLVLDGGVLNLLAGENRVDLAMNRLPASLYFVVVIDEQSRPLAQLKIVKH